VAAITWIKRVSPANDAKHFSSDTEKILVHAKSIDKFLPNRLARTEEQKGNYKNPDHDVRGVWNSVTYTCNKSADERPNLFYPIVNQLTGQEIWPKRTAVWKFNEETYRSHEVAGLLWWGKDGKGTTPRLKQFLINMGDVVPRSFWKYEHCGHTQEARTELLEIIFECPFTTPKPTRLIQRVLDIATDRDSIILDSFAGSGTTAHAVLKLNAQDGGSRRFILIEMMDYAETITAERVRRVMSGYGEGSKAVAGLGGGFRFQSLGAPLFDEFQYLNPAVGLAAIRDYVAYQEGIPVEACTPPESARHPYWLGEANGQRVFFCYEPARVTALDLDLLAELVQSPGPTLIYADQLALGEDFMRRHKLRFKKIPRDITRL
jgi:adenine-specific DNA-methyltransferase